MKKHALEIIKVMTPFPYTVEENASLGEALALMDEHQISHVPVTAEGSVTGIISREAVTRSLEQPGNKEAQSHLLVKEVTLKDPIMVDSHEKLLTVLQAMRNEHKHAVLVNHKDKLAGIFTSSDAILLLERLIADLPILPEPPNITA